MISFTALISIRRPWQILKPTQKLGCEFCDFCGILVEFFFGFEYNFWKKIIWDLRTLVYLSDRAVLLVMVFTVTIHKYLIITRVKINKTNNNQINVYLFIEGKYYRCLCISENYHTNHRLPNAFIHLHHLPYVICKRLPY